jgi:hypothetical protein
MINKKEKYLKNYLNYDTFKENLRKQQNKMLQLFNEETKNLNSKDSLLNIEQDTIFYKNLYSIENTNNHNIPLENSNNIFKIRLEQTKDNLLELSKSKWPNVIIGKNVLDIKGNVNYKYYIII